MAKSSLADLNNHLFAMIEKLGDENLAGDELKQEIDRAKAMSNLSKDVVANSRLVLDIARFKDEKLSEEPLPKMLGGGDGRA